MLLNNPRENFNHIKYYIILYSVINSSSGKEDSITQHVWLHQIIFKNGLISWKVMDKNILGRFLNLHFAPYKFILLWKYWGAILKKKCTESEGIVSWWRMCLALCCEFKFLLSHMHQQYGALSCDTLNIIAGYIIVKMYMSTTRRCVS